MSATNCLQCGEHFSRCRCDFCRIAADAWNAATFDYQNAVAVDTCGEITAAENLATLAAIAADLAGGCTWLRKHELVRESYKQRRDELQNNVVCEAAGNGR